ncbi:hypothetical protein HS041_22570 [Planomonospora sp. ID67723]|uniref:hypothetical protein n=1 Tax=Planomonospora sp. ID67723 TaxID=2738134 RepID=UPI0018C432A5|nr:hypothetical protein [Planomonospora sp. ID67723]MBG0830550.1 hypothetical protein [Planomonospora sp. ID67723]
MKFRDLTPGTLARVPDAPGGFDHLSAVLPPAVEILTVPVPCALPSCMAFEVMAREIDGGRPRLYHRRPDRGVIHITEATREAS